MDLVSTEVGESQRMDCVWLTASKNSQSHASVVAEAGKAVGHSQNGGHVWF
jgi:hypothetical protein